MADEVIEKSAPEVTPFVVVFPNLAIHYTSPTSYAADIKIDRTVDGIGRARSFYTQAKAAYSVMLPALTAAEVDTLMAFFNTNMAESFSLPWGCPPVNISVIFASAPQVTPLGAGLFSASFGVIAFP